MVGGAGAQILSLHPPLDGRDPGLSRGSMTPLPPTMTTCTSNRPSETVRSSTERRNTSFGSDPHGSGAWRGDVGGVGGDGRKLERGGGASISPAREQIDGSFEVNESREQ